MPELFNAHGWKIVLEEATLPDGRVKQVARAERADTVHLLATPNTGKILLLREFRPYYQTYVWMLPGGRADKEPDLHEAAQRELREETGLRAETLQHLWTASPSESINYSNHFFHATGLMPDPLPQDSDELMEVHTLGIEEAIDRVLTSPKVHLASAFALLRWLRGKV